MLTTNLRQSIKKLLMHGVVTAILLHVGSALHFCRAFPAHTALAWHADASRLQAAASVQGMSALPC
jgi:hypothetical protein